MWYRRVVGMEYTAAGPDRVRGKHIAISDEHATIEMPIRCRR
jgi:hypothetical protein